MRFLLVDIVKFSSNASIISNTPVIYQIINCSFFSITITIIFAYAYVYILAKNIAVTNEIYNKLSKLKQNNESFSDVIRRLISSISTISELSGKMTFSKKEWQEVKNAFSNQSSVDQRRKRELLDKVE